MTTHVEPPTRRKLTRTRHATAAIAVLIGVGYLVGELIGGTVLVGLVMFGIMLLTAAAVEVAAVRSAWARGLLDRRDERLTGLDLRATAVSGGLLIVAVLVGFVVDVARGGSGAPYDWLGALAGLTYLVSFCVLSRRS